MIRFPLLTERLLIRPLRMADAADLLAVYGDVETMQFLTPDVPRTLDGARDWVRTKIELFDADDGLSLWAVELRETGRVIGDVGLQWEDYGWGGRDVGLGGRGLRPLWRRGLGAEAAIACLHAGFTELEVGRICAETAPDNVGAQKVLLTAGFRQLGSNKQGWPVFGLNRADWMASAL